MTHLQAVVSACINDIPGVIVCPLVDFIGCRTPSPKVVGVGYGGVQVVRPVEVPYARNSDAGAGSCSS